MQIDIVFRFCALLYLFMSQISRVKGGPFNVVDISIPFLFSYCRSDLGKLLMEGILSRVDTATLFFERVNVVRGMLGRSHAWLNCKYVV